LTADNKKHRVFRLGIKWKISAYLAIFTLIIIMMLWLCQVFFLDNIYKSIKTNEIKFAASEITRALSDMDKLQETADAIADRNEVSILILRMENIDTAVPIATVEQFRGSLIHTIQDKEIFKLYDNAVSQGGKYLEHFRWDALTRRYYTVGVQNIDPSFNTVTAPFPNRTVAYSPLFFSSDEESIVYSLIAHDPSGNEILILLNSVISPLNATVKTLNLIWYVIAGVLILLAFVLSLIIARRVSRPIENINTAAKALAAGNYGANFSGKGYREIAELGDTLAYAAGELAKVDNLRRELIANISHDLRTPLTMITGYSEVMRDLPGELTPENAQIIIDEAKRLSSLVSDVLDISKLESGTQSAEFNKFNLTETLRETLERYNRLTEHDGYSIEFLADRDITVITDKTRFIQAFCNLVNNALTYTGPDKKVIVNQSLRIDLSDGKRFVRVSVTDSGEGIPADKLEKIWDRYYKINSIHKRATTGSGLGLSIVKNILNLLNGNCGVSSTPGQGSTFWIEIETLTQYN